MDRQVRVYGSDTSAETGATREYLQDLGVPHVYINVEEDSLAEERVLAWNEGRRVVPTLLLRSPGGAEILSVPPASELNQALIRHGLLPAASQSSNG